MASLALGPAGQYRTVKCVEEGLAGKEGAEAARRSSRPWPCASRLQLLSALAVVAVLLVVAAHHGCSSDRRPAPVSGDSSSSVGLFGGPVAVASAMASGITSAAQLVADAKATYPHLKESYNTLASPASKLREKITAANNVSRHLNISAMENLTKSELLHPAGEDRSDGNICADDEEAVAGFCYKKCADLTEQQYPIRTTAWSCCMAEPCSFFNSVFTNPLIPCSGFARAGEAEGQGCPHSPGACMPNEEFSLGVCYEKCAILTQGEFPFRSAASTCCRYPSHLACLDAMNVNTSTAFAVGGGLGDGHASTPGTAHSAMPQLTEHAPDGAPQGAPAAAAAAAAAAAPAGVPAVEPGSMQ